ncbi:hypothetical protein CU097_007495 [Rhizopus azygosporus]|uniref:RlpA-like protein double-psi beta-barrel domain-containing protein n=1 Tax=Rhizopus azygosporus TaxID=86630 RepID=A0A367J9U5_RHIAZ|nr:hypothetical protein CU097_007495 [Rhizopus azygosporus]CEJ02998.1 hypothetical protein RMCBS344292_16990 [Rhizopus microsporus]
MKLCSFLLCILFALLATLASSQPVNDKRGLGALVGSIIHGVATLFDPVREGGSQGACGPFATKHSHIVALNAHDYGDLNKKSHWCGKKIKIMYKERTTVATITDACPGCDAGCLDLTQAVWNELGEDPKVGRLKIKWAPCDSC